MVGTAVTGEQVDSANGAGHAGRGSTLAVYVEAGCVACHHARELAERARLEIPGVRVEVVDIGVSLEARPDAVFAVPTFTLDGEVISLGTPSWDELASRLGVALGDEDAGGGRADDAGGAA